jgi:hypothetical protein
MAVTPSGLTTRQPETYRPTEEGGRRPPRLGRLLQDLVAGRGAAGMVPRRPAWSPSKACGSSSRVSITKGPQAATGARIGSPPRIRVTIAAIGVLWLEWHYKRALDAWPLPADSDICEPGSPTVPRAETDRHQATSSPRRSWPGTPSAAPNAVGASNESQRVQPPSDVARPDQILLAAESMARRSTQSDGDRQLKRLLLLRKRSLVQIQYGPRFFENLSSTGSQKGSQVPAGLPNKRWSQRRHSGLCIAVPAVPVSSERLAVGAHRVRQPSRHPGHHARSVQHAA